MSITDELRAAIEALEVRHTHNDHDFTDYYYPSPSRRELTAIADNIDAEHERAVMSAMNDALYHANDESMAKLGWVRLPKDADGEYIHVGDMMERGKARGHVIALMLSDYPKKWGGELHWGVQLEGEQAPTALDAFFKHYHEPTVEDVLREFALAVCKDDALTIRRGVVEEFAKRLQLAGDAS